MSDFLLVQANFHQKNLNFLKQTSYFELETASDKRPYVSKHILSNKLNFPKVWYVGQVKELVEI